MKPSKRHPHWLWATVLILAVLHQDYWWWDDRTLVWGMVPIGLCYHAFFSVVAGAIWALACRWAWPEHIEEWAEEATGPSADQQSGKESSA